MVPPEPATTIMLQVSYLGKCITTSSSYSGRITDDMLCAGEAGKDACQVFRFGNCLQDLVCVIFIEHEGLQPRQGDSGGPLTALKDGRHTLIGVVSWGPLDGTCANPGLLGIYAEVAHFRDWLDSQLTSINTCSPPNVSTQSSFVEC